MPSGVQREVERLDAEAVAGDEQALRPAVPDREGEHAVESREHALPLDLVEAEDDLGVGLGPEGVPASFEIGAQLEEVVDLAVEGDGELPVLGEHGLAPASRGVEDGQALMGEPERTFLIEALVVRPPVGQAGAHRPQLTRSRRPPRTEIVDPRDATHSTTPPRETMASPGRSKSRHGGEAKNGPRRKRGTTPAARPHLGPSLPAPPTLARPRGSRPAPAAARSRGSSRRRGGGGRSRSASGAPRGSPGDR